MNVLNEGIIKIHKELSALEDGWDGYSSKKIKPKVLEALRDMSFYSYILKQYGSVGFKEIEVLIQPAPSGNVQFEAENDNLYFEIEVSEDYYERYLKGKLHGLSRM